MIKRKPKLEAKFFGPFWVLYPLKKQAYKLELPKKWTIHDIFYMSLLEQDTTRKKKVNNENTAEPDGGNKSEEYKAEAI